MLLVLQVSTGGISNPESQFPEVAQVEQLLYRKPVKTWKLGHLEM
jgi:hypothetical protein